MVSLSSKKVLVTGGAGFIGSTLVRELLQNNAEVIVLDNLFSGDLKNLQEIFDKIKFIKADILNKNLDSIISKNEVNYVFNLAAEPYIPDCYERPTKFFEVNANGTLNILMAAKKSGVERIVQYSTSEVYGSAKRTPMDENHPTLPLSTYAVSKLAADRLCFTLHHEQKIPVVIMRQFNVYGERETQPYVIPEIISQLSRSNKLFLGNISAVRDFTYVKDAARAAISLIKEKKAEGQTFNVGTGKAYSIKSIAEKIGTIMGHKKIEIFVDKDRLRPLDVQKLVCNFSKIKKFTSWLPQTSIIDGLAATVKDFQNNGNKWLWETKVKSEEQMWKK